MTTETNFSIKDFYSTINENGGLRLTHQFLIKVVELQQPSKAFKNLTFYARSANVPSVEQITGKLSYFGIDFEVPVQFKQENSIRLNIVIDNNMNLYTEILNWINSISKFNADKNNVESDTNNIMSGFGRKTINFPTITIDLLHEDLKTSVGTYWLYGCFPKIVGGFNLTHESAVPAVFDLNLTYQYFVYRNN